MSLPLKLSRTPYRVEHHQGLLAFQQLADTWNRVYATASRGPFSSFDWTRIWLRHFAPEHRVHVLEVLSKGKTMGLAPFIERKGRLLGMPLQLWQSPSNEHSQRVEWPLASPSSELIESVWETLRDEPWEVLLMKDVMEESPENQGLMHLGLRDGFLVWQWPSLDSPWMPLGHDVPEQALKTKFRANLRRRQKKLAQLGPVELTRVEGGPTMPQFLEEGLRLEASGWKGQQGTAILSAKETAGFYQDLAQAAASEGILALYLLSSRARPIAFHFGLEHRRRYFLLKPGYDESLKEYSPGQLLMAEVLEDLRARGVEEFEFLGPQMPWKQDWTDKIRPHCWTFVVRPTRKGRFLYSARFHWGPRLKHWLTEAMPWTT